MTLFGLLDTPRVFTPPPEDETGRAYAWYVHHYSAWFAAGLIAMHVAAAFWHVAILRDGLIARVGFARPYETARPSGSPSAPPAVLSASETAT